MTPEVPYPGPPAPTPPPDWFRTLWQAVSRVALFGVGAVLVFLPDTSDVQVTVGAALMLASAGVAIAKGIQ